MAGEVEKESRDPMIRQLAKMIEGDLRGRPESFSIQSELLQPDEVASHNGLLALFCYTASEACDEVMRKKLPLVYEHDQDALINVVPMTEASADNILTLWSHFLHYSLEEVIRNAKKEKKMVNGQIPLDEMYQNWHKAVQSGRYSIRPSTKPGADARQTG